MDKRRTQVVKGAQKAVEKPAKARSLSILESGIVTGSDFANAMSALMADIGAKRITPQVSNAICNAAGKLLKVVEMQYRYGTQDRTDGPRVLALAAAPARNSDDK